MEEEVKYLIFKLQESFEGETWYGDSMIEKINSIDYKTVNNTSSVLTNSVAKLIQHIINWRIFAINKLQGNKEFDIEINGSFDWEEVYIENRQDWEDLIKNLHQTQIELIEIVSTKTDVFLRNQVPGKLYDFKFLIEGIIQHDIYHLGQIGLGAKLKHQK